MTMRYQRQEIWLYLQFPLLSLEALLPELSPEQQSKPIAVISSQKNAQRVLCCNSQAGAWGIEPNLSISTALVLCPELMTLSRQPEKEQQQLQQLALLAYSFSPVVILPNERKQKSNNFKFSTRPLGLWLEISGCDKLFKGYNNLLQALAKKLQDQSISSVTGIAHNPMAAQLLCQPGFQCQLPTTTEIQQQLLSTNLSQLDCSTYQQQSFKRLGLNHVGDLLALSRSALSRRFDHQLMDIIAQLKNEKPFSARRFQPANSFRDVIKNPQGIFNKENLLFPMKTLLQRLCLYLSARYCHCRELEWHFEPLIGEAKTMKVQLSSRHNNWSDLLLLSRLQLERLELPRSIEQITLFSNQFIDVPQGSFNLDLFGEHHCSEQSSELIDRLNARLGIDALSRPILNQDYLPEQASSLANISKQTDDNPNKKSTAPQPLWLLTEPAPIQIRNQQLYWHQPLTIVSGPERICGNWWQTEQQRDYYLACDSSGARYWLFRETSSQRWFIHGLFS